jgi:hypothetical protein
MVPGFYDGATTVVGTHYFWKYSIRAAVEGIAVQGVYMWLDSNSGKYEALPPYALCGDNDPTTYPCDRSQTGESPLCAQPGDLWLNTCDGLTPGQHRVYAQACGALGCGPLATWTFTITNI